MLVHFDNLAVNILTV